MVDLLQLLLLYLAVMHPTVLVDLPSVYLVVKQYHLVMHLIVLH